jgi:L-amino acid N-acyltransferase YncA
LSLHAIPFDIMAFFGKSHEKARLLRAKEVIPVELEAAFDILGQIDHEWVWVLERDGKIAGILVASPCHGAAMIWRVVVSPGSSQMALGRLLRAFLRDCRKRGVKGYLTFVSLSREPEKRLASILEHAGGKIFQRDMVMIASPLPRESI